MAKKRLLTGLQPSGKLHIGNYFGAIKPFLERYEEFDSFLIIVDYHALTSLRDPRELSKNILEVAVDYLACGIDPSKVVLFRQSDVKEHTELAWIFECLVTVPFLMRAHAYKDKVAKGMEANAGLFNYPMLMAADILLYDAELVPVGEDQRQHIEYTREAANKFNSTYGTIFTPPQEIILENVGVVPGIDGQKMSKSYNNTIPLFGTREEIQKAVMSIVTDTKGTFPEHVHAIHKLYKSDIELKSLYEQNKGNYKVLKEALTFDIETHVAPLREKRQEFASNKAHVLEILAEGADRARKQAAKKMAIVRDRVGLTL
ncbi:tryptophan--tRNA ligase [Patescibacteria group bacterium]|nr:tryptophan--tRNA ligase [Patescibacteria group bacterium]